MDSMEAELVNLARQIRESRDEETIRKLRGQYNDLLRTVTIMADARKSEADARKSEADAQKVAAISECSRMFEEVNRELKVVEESCMSDSSETRRAEMNSVLQRKRILENALDAAVRVLKQDPWDNWEAKTSSTFSQDRERLRVELQGKCKKLRCQVTDRVKNVIASHIVPFSEIRDYTSDHDLMSAKNGLMLVKAVERAFDRRRFCFVATSMKNEFKLQILDPQLLAERIAAGGEYFRDFDQKILNLRLHAPSFTLLAKHASSALRKAERLKWIDAVRLEQLKPLVEFHSPPKHDEASVRTWVQPQPIKIEMV